jgi:general secretion pathway protein G
MKSSQIRNEAGFSLLEIMIVTAILALLAGIIVPKLTGRTDEARRAAAKTQIKEIENALEMFHLDHGFYPSTEQSLQALVVKPTTGRIPENWRDSYLKRLPLDPWNRPYVYKSPGLHGDYDLYSLGADGVEGGERQNADITNWTP